MPEDVSAYVYQIKVFGTLANQQVLNVFYYAGDVLCLDLAVLAQSVRTVVMDSALAILSSSYRYKQFIAQGVKGDYRFGVHNADVSGFVTGECLPPFVSWDFTYLREGSGERNGYKRFAGVPESLQDNGTATSGAIAVATTVAAALEQGINDGVSPFYPTIRRTRIKSVPQIPPKYFGISDVIYARIGTQNTRKIGRGA